MLQAHRLGPLALHFVHFDSSAGYRESGGKPLLHPEPSVLEHIVFAGQWW